MGAPLPGRSWSGIPWWCVCHLWLVVMTAGVAVAQPDSLSVLTSVDRERITVGDPIVYTITVLSPPGASVAWPGRDVRLGEFEVRSFVHLGPVARPGGHQADTLRYVVTVYNVGLQTIPALSFPYILRDGTRRTAVTKPVPITVVSVITGEPTDIRDLKEPAEIPAGHIPWYIWTGLTALLVAIIMGGIYVYRRRKQRPDIPIAPPVSPRLPHEVAYDELDQLAGLRLIEQGKIKEHYTVASETIRRYLAARYGIVAMEVTTTELLETLEKLPVQAEHIRPIGLFLRECDLVKFAKYIPDRESMDRSIDAARAIIDLTKAIPEPVILADKTEPLPP